MKVTHSMVVLTCLTGSLLASNDATLCESLNQAQFRNTGIVIDDSVFKKVTRDCFYIETD